MTRMPLEYAWTTQMPEQAMEMIKVVVSALPRSKCLELFFNFDSPRPMALLKKIYLRFGASGVTKIAKKLLNSLTRETAEPIVAQFLKERKCVELKLIHMIGYRPSFSTEIDEMRFNNFIVCGTVEQQNFQVKNVKQIVSTLSSNLDFLRHEFAEFRRKNGPSSQKKAEFGEGTETDETHLLEEMEDLFRDDPTTTTGREYHPPIQRRVHPFSNFFSQHRM